MSDLPFPFLSALAVVSLAVVATSTSASPMAVWSRSESMNNDWLYLADGSDDPPSNSDSGFVSVHLPHTWNASDTLKQKKYRQASSWYRKRLNFSPSDLLERHFLRFGAAGQHARVYLNGELLGEHRGGYSAFTLEMTDLLKVGDNRVDVWVSNAEDLDLGPLNADFNFYGGLYRSVQLVRAPRVCLSRNTRGGPGIRVWSNQVSKEQADLHARVVIDNGRDRLSTLRVNVELLDSHQRVVSKSDTDVVVEGVATVEVKLPPVAYPQLWSPENPHLYQLRTRLFDGGRCLDEATVNYGFRWFKFTNEGKFFLNGEVYKLRGVNRHQDLESFGNAVPMSHHERDIRLIKEVGANWLRLAHYQQDDYVLDLCDQLGLLVWEEIPFVNVLTDTEPFRQNYENMLREMIEQHHNHPSIIMWGVQNEILLKQTGLFHEEKVALTQRLAKVVREEDPHRVVVQAGHGITRYGEIGLPKLTDVVGYNLYYGWYGGEPEDLAKNMKELMQQEPNRPYVISEYGAGSDVRIHSEEMRSQDFSEEWQVHFLESYLDQAETMPICGTLWWNMFDFGSADRGDSIQHVNQKGLVAFDHQTKKDAWYYLKARWSDEPVLYLSSPRFTHRTGKPTKTYRVFSNFDEVELFHQGKSLGKQQEGFRWDLTLQPGENQLLARGRKGEHTDQHGFVVTYSPTHENGTPKLENYVPRQAEWELLWSDEFDNAGLPNPEIWQAEEGFIRNNELQYYTSSRAENARVEQGHLIIEAHKETWDNPHFDPEAEFWLNKREAAKYTAASLFTKDEKNILYGRIDVRAKLPTGRGLWPAIWILGLKSADIGWPECGELDIMEHVGFMPDKVWSAIHTDKYNWTRANQRKRIIALPDAQEQFHTYSVHWFADRLECFVDGECHFVYGKEENATTSAWPYDQPFQLKINLAIGGGLGGKKGVDESVFPQKFIIDYVRVYKQIQH